MIKIHLPSTLSTNTWVRCNYKKFDKYKVTRVTASKQTGGRGQFNRKWFSPKDQNIYLTYFFFLPKKTPHLSTLGQIFSLTMLKSLSAYEITPLIKWPNDLIVNNKKIGGVLVEIIDSGREYGVILGGGLNVNMPPDLLAKIDQPATSLFNELGKRFPFDPLLKRLDALFLQDLALYQKEGFAPFYTSYLAHLIHHGKRITLKQHGIRISGLFHTLSSDGRLSLSLPNGEIKTMSSGEIEDSTSIENS